MGMRPQPGVQRVRSQNLGLTHQHQRGLWMSIQKRQTCRERDSGTDVAPHGIDSNPDHGKTGSVKNWSSGKRKARRMSAGQCLQRELRFSFGFKHLAAAVKTGGADVVTQMGFAGG